MRCKVCGSMLHYAFNCNVKQLFFQKFFKEEFR